ncbi:hypothetical protein F0562_014152 [Nyssa sinensis]|uniref:Uncharacterized protein n=1 Tax=Nyssa sinensis TaxID=561372 RepID=A0A5J4ZQF2_9ASTE|nr:hypothetical protein F0562_014152 [Nyssa sinensis]
MAESLSVRGGLSGIQGSSNGEAILPVRFDDVVLGASYHWVEGSGKCCNKGNQRWRQRTKDSIQDELILADPCVLDGVNGWDAIDRDGLLRTWVGAIDKSEQIIVGEKSEKLETPRKIIRGSKLQGCLRSNIESKDGGRGAWMGWNSICSDRLHRDRQQLGTGPRERWALVKTVSPCEQQQKANNNGRERKKKEREKKIMLWYRREPMALIP